MRMAVEFLAGRLGLLLTGLISQDQPQGGSTAACIIGLLAAISTAAKPVPAAVKLEASELYPTADGRPWEQQLQGHLSMPDRASRCSQEPVWLCLSQRLVT